MRAVGTSGAGGAFCSALAFALISGIPKVEALTFANAAAAITTTRLGAQEAMPTLEEVLDLAGRRANGARLRSLFSKPPEKTPGRDSRALSGGTGPSADL